MMQFRKCNGNAESKLDGLCAMQDHELDRVSGGVADFPPNLMAILEPLHHGITTPSPGCPRV